MKFLFVFILMLNSCNGKTVQEDLKGKWLLCKTEFKGEVTIRNVCPEIEFTKDGKGKIIKPSKEEISFIYTLNIHSREITFILEANQCYFEEKDYFYKTHTENNIEILELSSKDGTSKYTLSREK